MDTTKITIHKFDNKFILKIGIKFHEETPFSTYIEAKHKAEDMIYKYGNKYEFIEITR